MIDTRGIDYFEPELLKRLYEYKVSNNTAKGVDRVSHEVFKPRLSDEIQSILKTLNNGSYRFSPYLEDLRIKNRDSAPRLISIPTIKDRLVLSGLKHALHEYFPESVRKQIASMYIREINKYTQLNAFIYFVKIDIKGFFDNIQHARLFRILDKKLPPLLSNITQNAISNATCPKNYFKIDINNYVPNKGVPQGISIYNILSEIYLKEIDDDLGKRTDIKYFRYVDDIVVLCNDLQIKNDLLKMIEIVGLEINEKKLKFGHIKDGFDYLGFSISDKKISIKAESVQKFIQKISGKITWLKKAIENPDIRPNWLKDEQTLIANFIDDINEKITGAINGSKGRGWMFRYNETNDLYQLYVIDKTISTFFSAIDYFDHKKPNDIKSIVRSYYEIKFKGLKSNYISNYNDISTVSDMKMWLVKRGVIKESDDFNDQYIKDLFEKRRDRNLKSLEKDEKELTGTY